MSVIIFPPCVHTNGLYDDSSDLPYLYHTTRYIHVEGIQIQINGVKGYVCSTIDITMREIPCTNVHEKREPSSSCSSSFNRHVPEHHPEIHLLSDDLAPDILLFLDVRVILDNDRSSFLGLALFSDSPSYTYVSYYETYANLFTHGLS